VALPYGRALDTFDNEQLSRVKVVQFERRVKHGGKANRNCGFPADF
jgi:hypothetical protein